MSYTPPHSGLIAMIMCAAWLCGPSLRAGIQGQTDPAKRQGKYFDHVVIVMMENQGLDEARSDPYIASLSEKGAWFSNYHAITHPSFPNYLAIVAGSTYGIEHDHEPRPLKGETIADRLEEKGLTWKSYAENYPGDCFLGEGAGAGRVTPAADPVELYARKHVPFLAFASIQNDHERCGHVVGASQFMRDARAGNLPNYSFYTPNMFNDGHDTSLEASSKWLRGFVTSLERTVAMHQRTLVVIVWDEGGSRDNRVLAVLIGDVMKPGKYSARVTHYSLLRTVEDNFALRSLGGADEHASPFPASVWR